VIPSSITSWQEFPIVKDTAVFCRFINLY